MDDPLEGVPGLLASVATWEDGRIRKLKGLDHGLAADTGHFVASVRMVLDNLLRIWGEVVELDTAPLRTWAIASDLHWIIGTGDRVWVFDRAAVDIGVVLKLLDHIGGGTGR